MRWAIFGAAWLGGTALAVLIGRYRRRTTTAAPPGRGTPVVGTVKTDRAEINVDMRGLRVTAFDDSTVDWRPHVELRWRFVRSLGFAGGVLVAESRDNSQQHVLDSDALSTEQWAELRELIRGATEGRLVLSLPEAPPGP